MIKVTLGFKKREKPIPEFERFAQIAAEFKKAVMMETWFGKFNLWILDRLSQMMDWWSKKWQRK